MLLIEIHAFDEGGKVRKEYRVFRKPMVYRVKSFGELTVGEKKWLRENRVEIVFHF